MIRAFLVCALSLLVTVSEVSADTLPDAAPPPAVKFFPLVPSAHMRPIVRSPYGINRSAQLLPRAAGGRNAVPSIPPSKNLQQSADMSDEAAKKLLSIYPER